MKKIFLAILLLGSIVPVSQFHAKTDELICLHEPDSWFKKKWNSFLSFFGAKATSPKNSSHEVLQVEGHSGDVIKADNQASKDQFMIDCYQRGDGKAKGNVVLDRNENSETRLTLDLVDELIKQQMIRAERANDQHNFIKTWIEMVSSVLSEKNTNVFKGVNVTEIAVNLENYFQTTKFKDTAAYRILGFEVNEPNNEKVIQRFKFLKLHLHGTTAGEQYNKLYQVIGDAIKQLGLQKRI